MTMKKNIIGLLAAASLLAATYCAFRGDNQPPLPRLEDDAVILAFGDSLTSGVGADDEDSSYPALLENLIGRKVINDGVPGEITAQGLERLPESMRTHQPDLVILCHGGNDFLQKTGMERAAANFRQMVELIQERGNAVVIIATPKPGLTLNPPDFYREIAAEYGAPCENRVLKAIIGDNTLKSDYIHPNSKGYAVLAEKIARLLRERGAIE